MDQNVVTFIGITALPEGYNSYQHHTDSLANLFLLPIWQVWEISRKNVWKTELRTGNATKTYSSLSLELSLIPRLQTLTRASFQMHPAENM